jgi:putative ABC transport system permease protein
LSYDNYHANHARIYQLFNQITVNGHLEAYDAQPSVLAPFVKASYPQVEEVNRLSGVGSFVLKHGDKRFESKGLLTDANFFKFFSYPFSEGNPATALAGLHNIVLTQQMAKKLFGNEDPMGKIVKIDSNANFTVTGVLQPLPANTRFNFVEYLVPLSYMHEVHWERTGWAFNTVDVSVMMKPGVSRQTAEKLFWNIYRGRLRDPSSHGIVLPMSQWWLYDYDNGKFVPGRLVMVRWFALIAGLVMLIACINYMNLGTARSAKRAKEVGIRKVAGAGRGLLIRQFLGESVLIALVAGVLAIGLAQLCLPAFNNLLNGQLTLPYGNPLFWLAVAGFMLFTGIIAGSYPAFYLSAYRPAKVLKGILKSAGALVAPRKVLVVVQFTLAIAFIICTLVIYRQIDFALHRSKGYNSDNLAYMYVKGDIAKNYAVIKHELEQSGAIADITRTNSPVNDIWTGSDQYTWAGKNPKQSISLQENFTDKDFTKTTGITLLAGRDIDISRYPTDTAAVLLTQAAVNTMGLKNPVGQLMRNGKTQLRVVGVIKDFVAGWAYSLASPIIIRGTAKQLSAINLRLNGAKPMSQNLSKVSAIFRKYNPDYPFVCLFVNDNFAYRLHDDENIGTIAAVFAGLTIFISCMGLFALAAFMAENRIKEIGIRKVLGASVTGLAAMLSKDFLLLVSLSFAIASPIAWWLMNKWLRNYPLHIHIGYWVFILTGAASLLIALVTVGFQAIKAAVLNPIRNLRSE